MLIKLNISDDSAVDVHDAYRPSQACNVARTGHNLHKPSPLFLGLSAISLHQVSSNGSIRLSDVTLSATAPELLLVLVFCFFSCINLPSKRCVAK